MLLQFYQIVLLVIFGILIGGNKIVVPYSGPASEGVFAGLGWCWTHFWGLFPRVRAMRRKKEEKENLFVAEPAVDEAELLGERPVLEPLE